MTSLSEEEAAQRGRIAQGMASDLGAALEDTVISYLHEGASEEQIRPIIAALKASELAVKNARATVNLYMGDWLRANGNKYQHTETSVWTVSRKAKSTKCPDRALVLRRLVEAVDGDLDEMAGYLASQPFKYGSLKAVLDKDLVNEMFPKEWKLDEEGNPEVAVREKDPTFTR